MAISIKDILHPPVPVVVNPDDNIAATLVRDYGWDPFDQDPRNPRLSLDEKGSVVLSNWDEKLLGKMPKIDDLRKAKKT